MSELSVVVIGFVANALEGSVPLTRYTVPVTFSNSALLKVNFKSSFCSAVQVEAFCDLKNEPKDGWTDTVLVPPTTVSPILAT